MITLIGDPLITCDTPVKLGIAREAILQLTIVKVT